MKRRQSGSDNKNNQSLGCKRFNKPTCLEQFLGSMVDHKHDVKSEKIKNRADRSENDHKITDKLHVPFTRGLYRFNIDIIQRDGDLGKIIEQIIKKDLRRHHGNKGQKESSSRHTEHIAQV